MQQTRALLKLCRMLRKRFVFTMSWLYAESFWKSLLNLLDLAEPLN